MPYAVSHPGIAAFIFFDSPISDGKSRRCIFLMVRIPSQFGAYQYFSREYRGNFYSKVYKPPGISERYAAHG